MSPRQRLLLALEMLSFLLIGLFTALLVWHWLSAVQGAPAPLPRRVRVKTMPRACVMLWCGVRYQTRFNRDGTYTASQTGSDFEGVWWMERIDGRDVLAIHETLTGWTAYITYRVYLDYGWRSGKIGRTEDGGEFSLEEK